MRPSISRFALLAWLVLAACARQSPEIEPTRTATPKPSATALEPTSPAEPTALLATESPTVTAEIVTVAPQPSLTVADQGLGVDGRLIVEQVTALQTGWLVVQADDNGGLGGVLGFAAVAEGENRALAVTIDPYEATSRLHLTLHADRGTAGSFDFPGPDNPVRAGSGLVRTTVEVEIQAPVPVIVVQDQEVGPEGIVVIDQVVAPVSSWLALHLDDQGQPGAVLAYHFVAAGVSEELSLLVDWRNATLVLHAVLHQDAGESGRFEFPGSDDPISLEDQLIVAAFQVFLPPDIYVLDQPVVGGTIVVERAVSYGPGWLVVYSDVDGGLGNAIGWALLEDGVNEQIVVPVAEQAITPELHLLVHQDLESFGEFGFPRTDPPALYQGRVPDPFTVRSTSGNYLVTRDQALSQGNTVTIPLVVVDNEAWIVVYADADGEPGEIVGNSWVPTGISREIVVEIDPELTTTTLYAILHLDTGLTEQFQYPDGPDIPLLRNGSVVGAPFALLSEDTS